MFIGYQDLNNILVKNRYPLPWIDELIDSLKGVEFFTKLDLKSGYHRILIESTDVWKMDFNTKEGLFEWLVMHFILTNSPTTFMQYMDDILRPFISNCVIIYLGDILIFSQSWEEHVKQIPQVFDTLQKHRLYLNMDKCSFAMTNIKYLGYVIDSIGIHVDLEKVQILKYWPIHKKHS